MAPRKSANHATQPSTALATLGDDELFRRLREDGPAHGPQAEAFRDELVTRISQRLYRFFASRAASEGIPPDRVRDLAEDLAQETVIRVVFDSRSATRVLSHGSNGEPHADDAGAIRTDFPGVQSNPWGYAFRVAQNLWTSRNRAERRDHVARAALAEVVHAPSPWDDWLERESEEEWEQRRELGERLRTAEADCAAELSRRPAPPRAQPRINELAAELWLWCSHRKGSAATFYAAAGVTARNTTRDLRTAERFMRRCLEARGLSARLVDGLCALVRHRATGGAE